MEIKFGCSNGSSSLGRNAFVSTYYDLGYFYFYGSGSVACFFPQARIREPCSFMLGGHLWFFPQDLYLLPVIWKRDLNMYSAHYFSDLSSSVMVPLSCSGMVPLAVKGSYCGSQVNGPVSQRVG